MGSDVTLAVRFFFTNGKIEEPLNTNRIILIPIALANFIFKIITKILAYRLGLVADRIIPPN